MTDKEHLARATKAQALLSDPELIAAFAAVRQALIERWESAPIRDREGAHEAKLMLKLLADVRANIEEVVKTGKVIQHRMNALQRAKNGITQWIK